jgi:hypothetical protein
MKNKEQLAIKQKLAIDEMKSRTDQLNKLLPIQYSLTTYRIIFENTGNSLAAWAAYKICRKNEISILQWVLDHLDKVAQNIDELKDIGERPEKIFYTTFGMNQHGTKSPIKHLERQLKIWSAIESVEGKLKCIGKKTFRGKPNVLRSLEDVISLVAGENDMKESTLKECYYKNREVYIDRLSLGVVPLSVEIEQCLTPL